MYELLYIISQKHQELNKVGYYFPETVVLIKHVTGTQCKELYYHILLLYSNK